MGGPYKLKKPCKFRTCVQSQGGKPEVKRIKVKKCQSKGKGKGRNRKVLKIDSDIEHETVKVVKGDVGGLHCEIEEERDVVVEKVTGKDSGMGSHDGEGREWGRRCVARGGNRVMRRMARLAEELSQSSQGEMAVVYQPRQHPNLPGLNFKQTVLCIGSNQPQPLGQVQVDSLASIRLEEEDVLHCRMPDLPPDSQVVVSVGLGLDLARIGLKTKENRDKVVTWLMELLELAFPEQLRMTAVEQVWTMLEDNLEYVGECCEEEANQFVQTVLELPEDVVEIASIITEEYAPDSLLESPNSATHLDLTGLSLNTTALNQAVDSMLMGQSVHGEDDNYSYTATVLDMDQLDMDSLTNIITPNRLAEHSSIFQTPGHGDMFDYPPLPHLPYNLEITPVSVPFQHQDHLTPTATEGYSFGFHEDHITNNIVPVALDTTNMVTIKAVPTLHRPQVTNQESPAVKSPNNQTVGGSDSEGRPGKRTRKEPSRFKDFTSPKLQS